MTEEEKVDNEENWLEEEATQLLGGDSLPVANGFVYIFSVYQKKPNPVKDNFGKEKRVWEIHFKALKKGTDKVSVADLTILEAEKPKSYEYINALDKNKDTKLVIAPTFSKQLAKFIIDNNVKFEKTSITLIRTGRSKATKYNFGLL